MDFERPFKIHKIIFFQKKLKKIQPGPSKIPVNLGRIRLPYTHVFLFDLNNVFYYCIFQSEVAYLDDGDS